MYISQIENKEQIENRNKYRTNWNKEQLENKPIIDSFFLFDINTRSGCRLHLHLVKYKFFTLSGYANNRTKRISPRQSEVLLRRQGTVRFSLCLILI